MGWRSYEEATTENGTLEPIRIGFTTEAQWKKRPKADRELRTFVLPKSPPASFGFFLAHLIVMSEGKFSFAGDGIYLLRKVMSEEDVDRLTDLVTDAGLAHFVQDLLEQYGWTFGDEGSVPNQEALLESISSRRPSDASEPSKPTGSATTAGVS